MKIDLWVSTPTSHELLGRNLNIDFAIQHSRYLLETNKFNRIIFKKVNDYFALTSLETSKDCDDISEKLEIFSMFCPKNENSYNIV